MRKRRFLAWLMTMVMAIGLMPATALADDVPPNLLQPDAVANEDVSISKMAVQTEEDTWNITMKVTPIKEIKMQPLELVLVLDASGSMSWCTEITPTGTKHKHEDGGKCSVTKDKWYKSRIYQATKEAENMLTNLQNANVDATISVVTFSRKYSAQVLTQNTKSYAEAISALQKLGKTEVTGSTYANDGLKEAYDLLKNKPESTTKAVVLLGDGKYDDNPNKLGDGTSSNTGYAPIIKGKDYTYYYWGSQTIKGLKNATIYTIAFAADEEAKGNLEATASEGQAYVADSTDALKNVFSQISSKIVPMVQDNMTSTATNKSDVKVDGKATVDDQKVDIVSDDGKTIRWNSETALEPSTTTTIRYTVKLDKDVQDMSVGENTINLNGDAVLSYAVGDTNKSLNFPLPKGTVTVGQLVEEYYLDDELVDGATKNHNKVIIYDADNDGTVDATFEWDANTKKPSDVEGAYYDKSVDSNEKEVGASGSVAASGITYTVKHYYTTKEPAYEVAVEYYYDSDAEANKFDDPTGQQNPFKVNNGENWTVTVDPDTAGNYIAPKIVKRQVDGEEVQYAFDPLLSDPMSGNEAATVKLVYCEDKIGPNGVPDGIPDKYQATVTFKVVNGTWNGTNKADKVNVVTLYDYDTDGNWDAINPAPSLDVPTGMQADTNYTGGAWNTTLGKTVQVTGNATYTYTFDKNKANVTVRYLIEGTSTQLKDDYVTSVEYGNNYDVTEQTNVPSLTDKDGNTYTKVSVEGNRTGTVAGPVEVKVYYSLDNWNDPGNSTTGGDRIPDKYQVLVKYEADTNGKIAKDAAKQEVLTILDDDNKYAESGDVTITGSEAEADYDCFFDNWTAAAENHTGWIAPDLSGEYEVLSGLTISVKGGATYTFTAHFTKPANITEVEKNVVTALVSGLELPAGMTITYPEVKDNVVQPIVCKVGDEINLLYAITVTGEEGSAFTLTEEAGTIFVGATLEDEDLVRTYRAPSQYIGTLTETEEATLYFIKSFTITDDTEKLTNAVTVEGIDEPIEEEVPVQKMVCITFHPNLPLDLYMGEMAPQYVVPGVETRLNDNAYTAEGYEFLGWSTEADAGTATYEDGDSISVTEDTTLYAVWKADLSQKWLVTYLAGEGSGTAKNEWVKDGESITIADPTELGFKGPFDSEFSHWEVWYVVGEGVDEGKDGDKGYTTEKDPKDEFEIIGRTILTAIWEEEAPPEVQPIVLTYHANYDGSDETVTKEYLGTENLVVVKDEDIFANTPTGKKFLGWSKTENGPVVYQPDDEFYIWVDTDLYAQWKNVEGISVTKTIEGDHTGPFEFGDKVTFKIVVENNSGETWNDLLLVEKPGKGLEPVENPWSWDAAREFLMKLPIMLIPDFDEDIFDLDNEPVVDEPKADEPKVDEPKADEPVVDEPVVDEPVVDEPKVDEPVVDEPVVDEPVVDEPVVEEPVVDEPKVDEPKVDEPTEFVVDEVAEVPAEALAFAASVPDEPYLVETEDGLCVIIPELNPGEEIEFFYTVEVVDTDEDYNPADYTNRVYIDGVEDAEDEVLVPVTGIEIEKSVEKNSKPEPGEWVIYEIVVTNTGAFDLTDVTVTEMPDDGYVDGYFCDENGKEDEDAVDATTYIIDELGAGEDVTLYYRAKVSSNAKNGDELLNDVRVKGELDNGDEVTATDSNDDVIVEKESRGGIPSKNRPTKPSKVEEVLNTEDHFQYVQGYPDNTVGPERNITRAEATVIFFRLLNDSVRAEYLDAENAFPDVNMNDWFNLGVSTMENGGFVSGYDDGLFRPNANITRAELATIISNFDDLEPATENKFADVEGHWAEKYINSAAEKGWLSGYEDGLFRPNQYITRAETMSMINRVLDRRVDADGLHAAAKQWKDNPESKWYYYAVLEATNYHEYERADVSDYENWTAIKAEKIWEN